MGRDIWDSLAGYCLSRAHTTSVCPALARAQGSLLEWVPHCAVGSASGLEADLLADFYRFSNTGQAEIGARAAGLGETSVVRAGDAPKNLSLKNPRLEFEVPRIVGIGHFRLTGGAHIGVRGQGPIVRQRFRRGTRVGKVANRKCPPPRLHVELADDRYDARQLQLLGNDVRHLGTWERAPAVRPSRRRTIAKVNRAAKETIVRARRYRRSVQPGPPSTVHSKGIERVLERLHTERAGAHSHARQPLLVQLRRLLNDISSGSNSRLVRRTGALRVLFGPNAVVIGVRLGRATDNVRTKVFREWLGAHGVLFVIQNWPFQGRVPGQAWQ